ncbi:complement factor H-related protein 3-like [Hippocampus zosterae]|uniref:complement factor H-related protein 3-like n=1 Tax=Hippocampus zosterae TaxID=109293 RepID=UPI00223CA0B5|nr:complement factor H-related protein 3-like [Hippocampus zosterae]
MLMLLFLLLWGSVGESFSENAQSPCPMPPNLVGGAIKDEVQEEYRNHDRVEYICQAAHIMEGGPYKICINGDWTGELRCLKPCVVTTETMSKHNVTLRFRNHNKLYAAHDESIQFRCSAGTTQSGTSGMRRRCNDGVLHVPTCM